MPSATAKKESKFTAKKMPKKGDYVLFVIHGHDGTEPFPMLVTSTNERLSLVTGHVFTDNYSFIAKDLHHQNDPWCDDHQDVLSKPQNGTWIDG